MAEFVYKAGKEPLIIQHENTALALYSEILSEYAPLLEPFACSFKVALYWIDSSTGVLSNGCRSVPATLVLSTVKCRETVSRCG